jgi:2-polyprenyl-3-methyl-5-hydroxy-6-metoxy-1,4-benzoquinol methylase
MTKETSADTVGESQRVESLAAWYFDEQLDFDKKLLQLRYETLKPYMHGPEGLELGSAEGEMTQMLLPHFEHLIAVDGAIDLLDAVPEAPNLAKVHSLFEDYRPDRTFNSIVMANILEHIDDPASLLRRAVQWLAPGGHILVIVPNANSIHRLVAVKMGLLETADALNERDLSLGHRRVYTRMRLLADIESAGLRPAHLGGNFFKPLTNRQIQDTWSNEMIRGFYELGKDFPDYAAELFAVCEHIA